MAIPLGARGGLALSQDGYEPKVLTVVTQTDGSTREVRINFGMFAGRSATAAEIDELAHVLLPELGSVTIVASERRELSETSETALHQVQIELDDDADVDRVVALAEEWAQACIAERHAEINEV